MDVDLAVIGAGLAGCSLVARLQQHGFGGSIAVVEAGRGPGGRTATRRSRQAEQWRLDHGAPGFNLTEPVAKEVADVLAPLRESGVLRSEWGLILGLDEHGSLVEPDHSDLMEGEWLRGFPTMARICEALLENTNTTVQTCFGRRVRSLSRNKQHWTLSDASDQWRLTAKQLVLSGNLLAHKRSLSMLAWPDVPLRQAVPPGEDPKLDEVISSLNATTASIRWNLMLECSMPSPQDLPRQILLTAMAQKRWGVERLVLHPQDNFGVGMVVHGLDSGQPIHPGNQEVLRKEQEQRLIQQLPEILHAAPKLKPMVETAQTLGVMRWGASRPLNNPLPTQLQWCPESEIGFCGDWIEGEGFGRAQGALTSGTALADRLIRCHVTE